MCCHVSLVRVERVGEQRNELVQFKVHLGHVDSGGDDHLDEFEVVCLCSANLLTETRAETVEGNVLSFTVVPTTLGHAFRFTNLH